VLLPRSTERGSPSRTASPLPAVMDPDQAALAAELLPAEPLVPIHYDGYSLPRLYEPVTNELKRLKSASNRVTTLGLGESIET
jgi:L-ascorbate metabolism protein UlaG (beta-lactamase superfamily)